MVWFIVAALLVGVDQLTKYAVLSSEHLMGGGHHTVIDGFFHIIYTMNRGAAWSILSDRSWGIYVLTAISLIVGVLLTIFLWKHRRGDKLFAFTLALVLAGTVGNLIDRVRFGGVVDFLDFQFGTWHFPTFNVADSCLTVGAILLILQMIFAYDKMERQVFGMPKESASPRDHDTADGVTEHGADDERMADDLTAQDKVVLSDEADRTVSSKDREAADNADKDPHGKIPRAPSTPTSGQADEPSQHDDGTSAWTE